MTYSYAIRITLPYDDCKHVVSKWADRSVQTIVYQHDPDEKTRQTHIHLALYNCDVKAEALKRMWPDAPGKGNEFWSFKDYYEDVSGTKCPVDMGFLTYGSKGTLRPVFVKNISPAIVEEKRQLWVDRSLRSDKKGDPSEHIIRKVMDYFKITDLQRYYLQNDEVEIGQPKYNLDLLLSHVRSKAFKVLWAQHRKAPHASHFKIIASTAFLRICEDSGCFDQAAAVLQNLWY